MDIRVFEADNQPRISTIELARILGISHEEMLRLIEDHRDELLKYGSIIERPIEKE